MGFMFALLALTAVAAHSQASMTYLQQTRQAPVTYNGGLRRRPVLPVRDNSYRDPRRHDAYDSPRRRQDSAAYSRLDSLRRDGKLRPASYDTRRQDGVFTRRDNSYLIGKLRSSSSSSSRGGSYVDTRRDSSYGRKDDRASVSSYDASRLVKDAVYNPRRAGRKPAYGSSDPVDSYGHSAGGRGQLNRGLDCNCGPYEVCERTRSGRPYCRQTSGAHGSLAGFKQGCRHVDPPIVKCRTTRGVSVYVFYDHTCRPLEVKAHDPYCQPLGRQNNLFASRLECHNSCM
ncbi:uncharacterized protein LOC143296549 [Babylonia areolata]|uniref:uncharacterized protein LOC143296549 n=1 Tax=Babylonia areolata TaxID=304850 RepID=UPI003FCEE95D